MGGPLALGRAGLPGGRAERVARLARRPCGLPEKFCFQRFAVPAGRVYR
jgi:hypothetical protein